MEDIKHTKYSRTSYVKKREIEDALVENMTRGEDGFYEYINGMSDHGIAVLVGDVTARAVMSMRHTLGLKARSRRTENIDETELAKRVAYLEKEIATLRVHLDAREQKESRDRIDGISAKINADWANRA